MNDFFKGQHVLVTGGTGLVGSHVVEKLLERGAKVTALDIVLKPKSYFMTQRLGDRAAVVMQDVRGLPAVTKFVAAEGVDYIFHLAAQALVTEAVLNPVLTLDTNIMGTVAVLEAARQAGAVKGVIVASSDKAYGKNSVDVSEDSPLAGDHPYDVSKSATDLISTAYHRTYGLPVAVSRFGNIYGPGDLNMDRIVPGIMDALINRKTLELRSDGTFLRDYVYVKDVADGYLALAEQIGKSAGHAFNFSSGHNFSVLGLIDKVSGVVGHRVEYKILNTQKNEIPAQSLNFEKVQKHLGWQPRHRLEDSIRETFDWYKNHLN